MSEALDETECDVLVVGGGPAGSTVAALLAQRGERVVLVEKEKHPRFHIGESLLPLNLPLIEQLGVGEEIRRIGMVKYGAQFVSNYHRKAVEFEFANAWDKNFPYAYQVRRSEFDHILLKNAAAKGATVVEECRIADVDFLPGGQGVRVGGRTSQGETRLWHAKFLVDATGRDTLLANRFGIKQRNRKHASAAMFAHFTGAQRLTGKEEGHITVFWFEHGWFWFIPLADGTTSIGAVGSPQYFKTRKTELTKFFMDTIALAPELVERLKHAEMVSAVTATGNYSYKCTRMTGDNFIMLGDAFAFIDPLFSTGVYLAMNSAFLGADVVSTCLHEPAESKRACAAFEAEISRAIDLYSWYIQRAPTPAMRHLLMVKRNMFRIEEAVLSVLAGDIFRPLPIRLKLLGFKAAYYINSLRILKSSLETWKMLRRMRKSAAENT
ncbi:MAG TPA: NAD(P)/FAD-dependent oxidoreductase [Stellaceae bacterium]|nr:NAD(P)/FAD-dependent oxidoreductase [Stellaceae bacterium]